LRHDRDFKRIRGAAWDCASNGGGLTGTIELMRPALRPDGLMLVGEAYWREDPPLRRTPR
jgi:hypothetical protein